MKGNISQLVHTSSGWSATRALGLRPLLSLLGSPPAPLPPDWGGVTIFGVPVLCVVTILGVPVVTTQCCVPVWYRVVENTRTRVRKFGGFGDIKHG